MSSPERVAIILAAGRGERMQPLTNHTPKPLLKAAGKRLIEYILEKLAAAHCQRVVINCAHLADQFPKALGNGENYNLDIKYSFEENALETAGGIKQALDLIANDTFLVINGDVWCDIPFEPLFQHTIGNNLAHLVMVNNPPQHPHGDFQLNGTQIEQKNDQNSKGLTYSGIGKYSSTMFADLPSGKCALRPLLDRAIEMQALSGEHYQGDWRDIGTPERLLELDKALSTTSN